MHKFAHKHDFKIVINMIKKSTALKILTLNLQIIGQNVLILAVPGRLTKVLPCCEFVSLPVDGINYSKSNN